jgi:cellobiose-specific phosphotransferase system component IIA
VVKLLAAPFETFERNIRDADAAIDQAHRAVMELLHAEKA